MLISDWWEKYPNMATSYSLRVYHILSVDFINGNDIFIYQVQPLLREYSQNRSISWCTPVHIHLYQTFDHCRLGTRPSPPSFDTCNMLFIIYKLQGYMSKQTQEVPDMFSFIRTIYISIKGPITLVYKWCLYVVLMSVY